MVSCYLQLCYNSVVLQYWICTDQDNKTLAHVLTIRGSNSYQDIRQNHWNLIKKVKLVLIQYSMSKNLVHMSAKNDHLLYFFHNVDTNG